MAVAVAGWPWPGGRVAVAGWPGGRGCGRGDGADGRVAGWPDGRVAGWPPGWVGRWAGGRVGGCGRVWPGGRGRGRMAGWLVGRDLWVGGGGGEERF